MEDKTGSSALLDGAYVNLAPDIPPATLEMSRKIDSGPLIGVLTQSGGGTRPS
jgi:hypothetical protein